jgi:hypothetical protein
MVWYKIHSTIILPDLDNTIKINTVFIYIFIYMQKTNITLLMFITLCKARANMTSTNCGTGTASLAERSSSTLVVSGAHVTGSLFFGVKFCISWLVLLSFFYIVIPVLLRKELGDINEVIRIRTMKTSRQPNGQKKSTKGQTTIYKTHTTIRIEQRYSLLITL